MKNILKSTVVSLALLVGLVALASKVAARSGNPIMDATSPQSTAEYITVYNADNVTHEVGDVVVFATDATYGIEITTTASANSGLVAGVIALQDCEAAKMCTVQTYGYHATVTVGVATSAGDALVTSTTGEAAGVYSVLQATSTNPNTHGVFAIALEATTSSTTVKAYLLR